MHELNEKSKNSLLKRTGLTFDELVNMSAEDIDAHIERKIGKSLKFSVSMKNLVNRGSVYLFFRRLISSKKLNRKLSKI